MSSRFSTAYDDDQPLWQRALHEHDLNAFQALAARHLRWVTAVAACHVSDDAVPVVGTAVMEHAWRNLGDMPQQRGAPFAHWLLKLTRHECASHCHRHPQQIRQAPKLEADDWMVPERIAQAALLGLPAAQRELIAAAQDGQQSYQRLCEIFFLRQSVLERQLLVARQALAKAHEEFKLAINRMNQGGQAHSPTSWAL